MRKLFFIFLIGRRVGRTVYLSRSKGDGPRNDCHSCPRRRQMCGNRGAVCMRGVQNGGRHLLKMGENIFDLFRLPVGILQATLGSPFGMFSSGMKNIVSGTLAPLSLTLNTLLLPLAFSGLNLNPG